MSQEACGLRKYGLENYWVYIRGTARYYLFYPAYAALYPKTSHTESHFEAILQAKDPKIKLFKYVALAHNPRFLAAESYSVLLRVNKSFEEYHRKKHLPELFTNVGHKMSYCDTADGQRSVEKYAQCLAFYEGALDHAVRTELFLRNPLKYDFGQNDFWIVHSVPAIWGMIKAYKQRGVLLTAFEEKSLAPILDVMSTFAKRVKLVGSIASRNKVPLSTLPVFYLICNVVFFGWAIVRDRIESSNETGKEWVLCEGKAASLSREDNAPIPIHDRKNGDLSYPWLQAWGSVLTYKAKV
jgi:hypothetical protein